MAHIEESANGRFEGILFEGSWRWRVNAGGCRYNQATFLTNPQYHVTVVDPDDGDEDGECMVIIELMQKDRRKLRSEGMGISQLGTLSTKWRLTIHREHSTNTSSIHMLNPPNRRNSSTYSRSPTTTNCCRATTSLAVDVLLERGGRFCAEGLQREEGSQGT